MPSQSSRLAAVLVPAGAQMPVVEPEHLRRQPRGNVHAVGDVADGHRVLLPAGIQHLSTSRATLRRAAPRRHWRAARSFSAQHRHAELFVVVAADSRGPGPSSARCESPSASRSGPRCSSIKSGVEAIVPGRHRRVRGEDHFARHARRGLLEAEPFFLHAAANGFQHRERAVPFVQVQHARA